MSHFSSSSFEWTSMTNQEYWEKNDSRFVDLFENVAARFTYAPLALVAIIETIGSAVAAVFVSLSLLIPGNEWGARKAYAITFWQRSALSSLAAALDVLGFFSPWLTSECIGQITTRFFPENKGETDESAVQEQSAPVEASLSESEELRQAREEYASLPKPEISSPAAYFQRELKLVVDVAPDTTNAETYQQAIMHLKNLQTLAAVVEELIQSVNLSQETKPELLQPIVSSQARQHVLEIARKKDLAQLIAKEQLNTCLEVFTQDVQTKINDPWGKKEKQLKDQLWTKCCNALRNQSVKHLIFPIRPNTEVLYQYLLKENGCNPLDVDVQARIQNLRDLLLKFDTKAHAYFTQLAADKKKQNGAASENQPSAALPTMGVEERKIQNETTFTKWREETLPPMVRLNASEAWQKVFTTDMDAEEAIEAQIQEIFDHTEVNLEDHLDSFEKKLGPRLSSCAKTVKTHFLKVFQAQKKCLENIGKKSINFSDEDRNIVTILGLEGLLKLDESAPEDEYLRQTALSQNLPQLHRLLTNIITHFRQRVTNEVASGEEIIEQAHPIFVSCAKEKACRFAANLEVPYAFIKGAANAFLKPIKEENEKTLAEIEKQYDSWASKRPEYDPSNPPSIKDIAKFDLRSKATMRKKPAAFRRRLEEVFADVTSPDAETELQESIDAKRGGE